MRRTPREDGLREGQARQEEHHRAMVHGYGEARNRPRGVRRGRRGCNERALLTSLGRRTDGLGALGV